MTARQLRHNGPPEVTLGTTPVGRPLRTEETHVCGFGHFWPTGINDVTIIRLLGTTAAGKTMLLRNLAGQDVGALEGGVVSRGPVMFVDPPRICRRPFDVAVHPAATQAVGQTESFRQVLEEDWLNVKADELTAFLERAQLPSGHAELFGTGDNWPIHLLVKKGPVTQDNLFVDSSGEATAGNEERWATLKLHQSDGILWVIDGGLLPEVENEMAVHDPRLLVESTRPQQLGPDWQTRAAAVYEEAAQAQRSLSDERRQLTRRLAERFAVKSQDLPDVSLRSVVLSKADMIHWMLSRTPGWEGFRRPGQPLGVFLDAFTAGGTAFVRSYTAWRARYAVGGGTDLLEYLAAIEATNPAVESRLRCERVARAVLEFYGDPDHFYELVCHETTVSHIIDVPGEGATRGVRLTVPPIHASWADYRTATGRQTQHRDLVVGVLVRSLLGYCLDIHQFTAAETIAPVRYFLTAPLDGRRQAAFPAGDASRNETPGVLHLLSWVLA